MAHIFFICMEYFFLFIWQIISIYMATFFYFIYMTKYFDIYGKNVDLYVWQNTEFALIGPLHRAERVQSRLDERLPHRAPHVEGRVLDVHRRRHEQRVLPHSELHILGFFLELLVLLAVVDGGEDLPQDQRQETQGNHRSDRSQHHLDNVELLRTLLVFAREHRVVPCAGAILVREGEVAATLSVREGTELGAGGNLGVQRVQHNGYDGAVSALLSLPFPVHQTVHALLHFQALPAGARRTVLAVSARVEDVVDGIAGALAAHAGAFA